MSYCEFIRQNPERNWHHSFHECEHGVRPASDRDFFERLMLEVNQAGLSWDIILKRRIGLAEAYSDWDIPTVAAYTEPDILRLLVDPRIIRHRQKIQAAIYNANAFLKLQAEYGTIGAFLDAQPCEDLKSWVSLFRSKFKFTGPEIVNEFLVGTGILPGAHDEKCLALRSAV